MGSKGSNINWPSGNSNQQPLDATEFRKSIRVKPRHMDFKFPDRIPKYWANDNPYITHFLNALSSVFPEGERFFIDSVRNYVDKIDDPRLKREIRGFIGQEAHHGKHHTLFNDLVEKQGVPMDAISRYLKRTLNHARKNLSHEHQLAITISLEHFTAIMAHRALVNDDLFDGVLPEFANLIRWHAIEETEHKAVAFDVYRKIGGRESVRKRVMIETTVLFLGNIFAMQLFFLIKDGFPIRPVKLFKSIDFLFGRVGFLRKIIPDYLDYFKTDFHPWQHNNAHLVSNWKSRYQHVEQNLVAET